MNKDIIYLIDKLAHEHSLTEEQYFELITKHDEEDAKYLAKKALSEKQKHYGNKIFIRGLIEISNYCKNDCYYCGIRRSNKNCIRYRLTEQQILDCCREGYELGFRTFVLQGGEDGYFTDEILVPLIKKIKLDFPDCAITLSLGERTEESFNALRDAGADRYLLRHETIDINHYSILHPKEMSWQNRMDCLHNLREIGYQVGCGFMVGSPMQTKKMLAQELVFIEHFKPDMCGIGPFIPHSDTPFCDMPNGSAELTCVLLSCIRLIHPKILLPATTALGTIHNQGREMGILAGANVVMPNLSPLDTRKKYMLYNNKLAIGAESAQAKEELEKRLNSIGCEIVVHRGDIAE